MTIRPYVSASVAWLVAVSPLPALAGSLGASDPTLSQSSGVVAGQQVQVTCTATGAGGWFNPDLPQSIDVTVDGGTLDQSSFACSANPCSASATWTTSATPGTYAVTCTATFSGSWPSDTKSASITTVAGSTPPTVSMSGPSEVLVDKAATFSANASDPNDPPQPLTYSWSATGGTFTGAIDQPTVSWTAPSSAGTYDVTVTVSSSGGQAASSTKKVSAVLALYQATLDFRVAAPRRMSADATHDALLLVDSHAQPPGSVALLTKRGEYRGVAMVGEDALAIAEGGGWGWVTTTKGSLFKIDPVTGRSLGKVPLASPLSSPCGIAYDAKNDRIWITEFGGAVRILRPDGTAFATITRAGDASLLTAADVAIDSAGGRAWVVLQEPNESGKFVHQYDLNGTWVASFVGRSDASGPISRAGGIAVGAGGRVYVSDSFQGYVQAYAPAGTFVGTVGTFGENPGELFTPLGMAFMANGDLLVSDVTFGRVSRFGDGTALPVCAGDSDCDGLPDDWEIAHGLDPNNPADALLAFGNGRSNLEEYLLAQVQPKQPYDHIAVAVSGPAQTPPGLVRLTAVASGIDGNCGVRWAQKGGPPVALSSATSLSPTFIARKAATYLFDVVAICGTVRSAAARVAVAVLNVPPFADGGRTVVAIPGSTVKLDARFSSDANGDTLSYSWDQMLGKSIGTQSGAVLTVRPRDQGLYAFAVTAADKVNSSSAEVPVLITKDNVPVATAIAVATPTSEPQVGDTVQLDASASLVDPSQPTAFNWEQVGGKTVTISGSTDPVASFMPDQAGRYTFAVSVSQNGLGGPKAVVDVFVSEAGFALPVVTSASAPSTTAVNVPVSLEASADPNLTFGWKQVAGPSGGLTDANKQKATVVPFSPGYYVFEVVAKDGAAESRPVRVAFEARTGGKAIPQAQAKVQGMAPFTVGQLVILDGRDSTGAAHYRWTQVAGPWVVVSGDAVARFIAHSPGTYAFELEVDDGTVRSAPFEVQIDVVAGGAQ